MSDNNTWPGKPGVPLNPERDGWHWVDDGVNGTEPRFWGAAFAEWDGYPLWMAKEWGYLRPCSPDDLTPCEVDARVKEALKWRDAINDGLTANCQNPIGPTETPNDALHRLLQWEITLALDPVISKSAADLVAQARREALEGECDD